MNHLFQYLVGALLLTLAVSFNSCTTTMTCGYDKDAFVDNYYSFVDEVRKAQQKGDISSNEWQAYDEQLHVFTSDCYNKYEKELTTTDKMGIAYCTGFYLYAKHGMAVVTKIMEQDAAIRKIIAEIDPMLMFKIGQEILNNPDELRNIMGDLEKRYGS